MARRNRPMMPMMGAAPVPPDRQDFVDPYRSKSNCSYPNFNGPMHDFLGAVDRCQGAKMEMEHERKMNRMVKQEKTPEQCAEHWRDESIKHTYRQNYTDMRGTQTKRRENMVVPKDKSQWDY